MGQPPQQNGGQAVLVAQARIQAASFSGPLPHPDILAQYDQLLPGTAARIIEMANSQSEHRMALEKAAIHGEIHRANWGIVSAVVVSLAILGSGTLCILKGHDVAGGAIVAIDMAAVATAFLVGTVQRRREREAKAATQGTLAGRK